MFYLSRWWGDGGDRRDDGVNVLFIEMVENRRDDGVNVLFIEISWRTEGTMV